MANAVSDITLQSRAAAELPFHNGILAPNLSEIKDLLCRTYNTTEWFPINAAKWLGTNYAGPKTRFHRGA
jgi:hypothetical protein